MNLPNNPVICIDDSIPAEHLLSISLLYPNWVKKNKTYKVRGVYDMGNEVGFLLEEVVNPLTDTIIPGVMLEPAFNSRRFRELNDLEVLELEEPSFKPEELIIVGQW